jgi:hypothetical protein
MFEKYAVSECCICQKTNLFLVIISTCTRENFKQEVPLKLRDLNLIYVIENNIGNNDRIC